MGFLCLLIQLQLPMASDPASDPDLILFYYKNKWIKKVKKNDIRQARRFINVFMFINELFTLNDGREFDWIFKWIYPAELVLKKEHLSNKKWSYLDLFINIDNIQFFFKLYKRDDFSFSIVRMPYLRSSV